MVNRGEEKVWVQMNVVPRSIDIDRCIKISQIVDYMERDSARGEIQPGLKILARFGQTGLGFSARAEKIS